MTGDLVVNLTAGTYAVGIAFTSADSGQGGHQVIYQADQLRQPVPLWSGSNELGG